MTEIKSNYPITSHAMRKAYFLNQGGFLSKGAARIIMISSIALHILETAYQATASALKITLGIPLRYSVGQISWGGKNLADRLDPNRNTSFRGTASSLYRTVECGVFNSWMVPLVGFFSPDFALKVYKSEYAKYCAGDYQLVQEEKDHAKLNAKHQDFADIKLSTVNENNVKQLQAFIGTLEAASAKTKSHVTTFSDTSLNQRSDALTVGLATILNQSKILLQTYKDNVELNKLKAFNNELTALTSKYVVLQSKDPSPATQEEINALAADVQKKREEFDELVRSGIIIEQSPAAKAEQNTIVGKFATLDMAKLQKNHDLKLATQKFNLAKVLYDKIVSEYTDLGSKIMRSKHPLEGEKLHALENEVTQNYLRIKERRERLENLKILINSENLRDFPIQHKQDVEVMIRDLDNFENNSLLSALIDRRFNQSVEAVNDKVAVVEREYQDIRLAIQNFPIKGSESDLNALKARLQVMIVNRNKVMEEIQKVIENYHDDRKKRFPNVQKEIEQAFDKVQGLSINDLNNALNLPTLRVAKNKVLALSEEILKEAPKPDMNMEQVNAYFEGRINQIDQQIAKCAELVEKVKLSGSKGAHLQAEAILKQAQKAKIDRAIFPAKLDDILNVSEAEGYYGDDSDDDLTKIIEHLFVYGGSFVLLRNDDLQAVGIQSKFGQVQDLREELTRRGLSTLQAFKDHKIYTRAILKEYLAAHP